MSDTQYADDDGQSIDDQRDTATGGLTNDMPGLPAQPPARPPSPIGGLASIVQRMLGGAAPPQPAGPGRSPFQFPGQSQIPQGPAGGPQSHQNTSRWQGNTASIALPKGSMQPQANFTPFMRSQPTTSYAQWGQIEPFAQLPQSFEAPSLYQGIANFFGKNGSNSIIPLALSMNKNGAAFLNGIMKGQEQAAKMHRQKLEDDAFELEQRQHREMTEYFDTVNEYRTVAGTPSGEAAKNYAINGVTLLDALGQQAMELGDDKFEAVVATGSVDKALQFLNERNDNWQTLAKTNKSVQKQGDEDAKEELGIPKGESGSEEGTRESPGGPYRVAQPPAQAAPPGATPQGGPAPAAAGGPPTPGGEQTAPLKPYQELGNSYLKGEGSINSQRAAVRPYIANWMAQQQQKLEQVQADKAAGRITDDQVPNALEKILPGASSDYKSIYEGNSPPPGAAARSPYWQTLRSLAAPDPIVQAQTKRDFAPGGKDGTRLIAGWRMGPAVVNVLKALKDIPENEPVPYYMADALIAGKWTGDPKYIGLFNAMNSYVQEAQALNSPTGRFFVTEVESIKKQLQTTSGPKAIRTILQQDAATSTALIDGLRDSWRRGSREKNDPPTYDPDKTDILRATTGLDPRTGRWAVPDDKLPPELRGLGQGDTGQGGNKGPEPNDGFSNFRVNP